MGLGDYAYGSEGPGPNEVAAGPSSVFNYGGHEWNPGQDYHPFGLDAIVKGWGPDRGGLAGAQGFWNAAPDAFRSQYAGWDPSGAAFQAAWHRLFG